MEFHVHYGIPIHEISSFQPTDREHPSFCAHQLLPSGQLDQGRELLLRCLRSLLRTRSPTYLLELLAYQRAGDLPRASEHVARALAAHPRNPAALQEPGRLLRPGGRQPAGSLLPAPLQRVPSPGPADRARLRLRLYGAARHRAGPGAIPGGAEDEGTRGAARPGQEWAARDGGPRTQGQGGREERRSSIRLGTVALSREIAAGDSRNYILKKLGV